MSGKLEEQYTGKIVIEKVRFLEIPLNMAYKRIETTVDHVLVINSDYALLDTKQSELKESMKMKIMPATPKDLSE